MGGWVDEENNFLPKYSLINLFIYQFINTFIIMLH